jgi:hypothetical protein
MSDKNYPQMNSVRRVYPESRLLLCWWHVLHAWQQHFVTSHYPELWDLLKGWIRLTEEATFEQQWEKIKKIAPESVVTYLTKEWLGDRDLWSAVARKGRSVLELGDTNMLVEAYVVKLNLSCHSHKIISGGTIFLRGASWMANEIAASTT